MKVKAPIFLLLFFFPLFLYASFLEYLDVEIKTNYDLLDEFELTGTDSIYPPSGNPTNTLSFSLELLANYKKLAFGGGTTYQIPTYHSAFGDFHFIPIYFLAKLKLVENSKDQSIYLLYNIGRNHHLGTFDYKGSADLSDGQYTAFGIGFNLGEFFVVELAQKKNTGKRKNEKVGNKIYNMDVSYSTISISFGIKNSLSHFFRNYY